MPINPPRGCSRPRCINVTHSMFCREHSHLEKKGSRPDKRRSASQRGYTSRWRREAKSFLVRHAYCVSCMTEGIVKGAEVVDHITPHKGDMRLFWNVRNWQALCSHCHNKKTVEENGGFGKNIKKVYGYDFLEES